MARSTFLARYIFLWNVESHAKNKILSVDVIESTLISHIQNNLFTLTFVRFIIISIVGRVISFVGTINIKTRQNCIYDWFMFLLLILKYYFLISRFHSITKNFIITNLLNLSTKILSTFIYFTDPLNTQKSHTILQFFSSFYESLNIH